MAAYNPQNLMFGKSAPASGINQFGGASDWTQPATSRAASAVTAAQNALEKPTWATEPISDPRPAGDTNPNTTTVSPLAPTNYSTFGGRPGETPGNFFTPQYGADGTPLAGSAAAMNAAIAASTPSAAVQSRTPEEQAAWWSNFQTTNPESYAATMDAGRNAQQQAQDALLLTPEQQAAIAENASYGMTAWGHGADNNLIFWDPLSLNRNSFGMRLT